MCWSDVHLNLVFGRRRHRLATGTKWRSTSATTSMESAREEPIPARLASGPTHPRRRRQDRVSGVRWRRCRGASTKLAANQCSRCQPARSTTTSRRATAPRSARRCSSPSLGSTKETIAGAAPLPRSRWPSLKGGCSNRPRAMPRRGRAPASAAGHRRNLTARSVRAPGNRTNDAGARGHSWRTRTAARSACRKLF